MSIYYINSELSHHGVKGQKWGVRKHDYRSRSIRGAIARRQNDKIDKSFKKWNTGASNRESAITAGKKRNESKMTYELNKTKENKAQYKADNKAYKKALKQNTTYRKGTVREEVGKDMSRKYMSEAKKAKKAGDMNTYGKLMNKHDVERAKARRAQQVAANRSNRKAALKRSMTMAVKTAVVSAAVAGGLKYAESKGVNISVDQVNNASNYIKTAKKVMSYMY